MIQQILKEGDIVKFKTYFPNEDQTIKYQILELRGERVLLLALVNMNIQPTSVVLIDDIILY
jgi:hypothetical protein